MATDLGFYARTGWGVGSPIVSWGLGALSPGIQPQPQPQPPEFRPPSLVEQGGAPLMWGALGGVDWEEADGWVCTTADWMGERICRRKTVMEAAGAASDLADALASARRKKAAAAIWHHHFAPDRDPQPRTDFGLVLSDEVLFVAAQAAAAGRLQPPVRSWAIRCLVEAGGPQAASERLTALYRAVQSSMLHVPNPVGAQWVAAAEMTTPDGDRSAELGGGSCVDYAVKLGAALLSVGIPAALVGQSSRSDGVCDHVAVAALDGDDWVRLDASDPGMAPGDSRPSTHEVWLHLPDVEVAHRGPPPQQVRMPSLPADQAFPMVGVGQLGWPAGAPIPTMALAQPSEPLRGYLGAFFFALAAVGVTALVLWALSKAEAPAAGR